MNSTPSPIYGRINRKANGNPRIVGKYYDTVARAAADLLGWSGAAAEVGLLAAVEIMPRSHGVSVEALSRARKSPREKPASVVPIRGDAEAGGTRGGLIVSEKGQIKACEHNARMLIAKSRVYAGLHYDTYLSRMRDGTRDWSDADDINVLCWLQDVHRAPGFTLGQARNGCRAVAYDRQRDSLREFVEGLPDWDGTERVAAALMQAWGAPRTPLSCSASKNLFVALIARALDPGSQVDTVFCFEGPQGIGKSQALRALGGEFHAEISASIGTADFMRELRGVWLAELSELDSLRGREASTVKRLLSAPTDRFVQKYALHAERYPRRAVAVATTNESDYWHDPTGARRLVPIRCGQIKVDLIEANRLQWFAEALQLYRDGVSWWKFPVDIGVAQEDRQEVDPWEDTLRDLMSHGRQIGIDEYGREAWPQGWISSAAIMRDWLSLPTGQQGRPSGVRLGRVMRRLGFSARRNASGSERGWVPDTAGPERQIQVSEPFSYKTDTSDASDT
jgi:hypothetical protein